MPLSRRDFLARTWVHSGTGLKLPLPRIAAAVANINAGRDEAHHILICVDGVHASKTPPWANWAATFSWPAATNGCSVHPGWSGAARAAGNTCCQA